MQRRPERGMDFDFGELFTNSVQQIVPATQRKGLVFSFDYRGPRFEFAGTSDLMRRALHRLFSAAVDAFNAGVVHFTADAVPSGAEAPSTYRVTVDIACSDASLTADRVDVLMQRLGMMRSQEREQTLPSGSQFGYGPCSVSGGKLYFQHIRAEGSLLTLTVELASAGLAEDDTPDAKGAIAWVISEEPLRANSIVRRLRRLGWSAVTFASIDAAADCASSSDTSSPPTLLLAFEGSTVTLARLRWLWAMMPNVVEVVFGVVAGSRTQVQAAHDPAIDLRVIPLSPLELHALTRRAVDQRRLRSHRSTASGRAPRQPRALVVDDNAVNRLVATGLLQVLGFEVETANDGTDAVEACRRGAPDFVLMDIRMPRMDGLEATRRLRALQRDGSLPPFPIVAATASVIDALPTACAAAGMDGVVEKPLSMSALDQEVRRLLLPTMSS